MKAKLDPLLLLLALLCVGSVFMGGMLAAGGATLAPGFGTSFLAALGGQDLPTYSHALLGLLIGAGCVWMVATRKVIQLPQNRVLAPLLTFMGLVALSVLISQFKGPSLAAAAEWILYALAFLFASAAMGRKQGPYLVVLVLFGSILYMASLGLREWKTSPEGWRIFALWTPNTQAGVQIIGIFLALGLLISRIGDKTPEKKPDDVLRLEFLIPLFAVLGIGLMGFALLLTGSKGGVLSLMASMAFFATALGILQWAPKVLPWLARIAMAVVVLVCFVPGLVSRPPDAAAMKLESKAPEAGALARIQNVGASSEQSVGFRKLLWITAYRTLRQNPLGTGIGSFLYYSAQPGLTTQTQTAHNSFLQVAVEAGPLAAIALFAFLFLWMESACRSAETEPKPRARLRLAIVAAVLSILFQSATESNLYTFGMGILLFVLLAVASQLSPDGVSPEFVPRPAKTVLGVVAAIASLLLLTKGWAEVTRANMRYALHARDTEGAKAAGDTLAAIAADDAETWYMQGYLQTSEEARANDLRMAISHGPVPRYFRALAQSQINHGDLAAAQSTLRDCFRWDPQNLPGHLLMLKAIDPAQHPEELATEAQKLIAIENTPYFQIRSIPDLVPTETYLARKYLADLEKDPAKKAALLRDAITGLNEYVSKTIPKIVQTLKEDPSGGLSPEPPDKAIGVMREAADCADALASLEKQQGHAAEAANAEEAKQAFVKASQSLSSG